MEQSPLDPHLSNAPIPDAVTPMPDLSDARVWKFALIAAVISAAVTSVAGENTKRFFPARLSEVTILGAKQFIVTPDDRDRFVLENGAYTTVVFAATIGLILGIAGGLASGSLPRGVRAGIAGGLLGGCAAGAVSYLAIRYFVKNLDPISSDLILPLTTHIGMWAPIGLASGLAFGLGLGGAARASKALTGGLIGALLGAVLYEILGAQVFPLGETIQPIAKDMGPRVLSRCVVSIFICLGAATTVLSRSRR